MPANVTSGTSIAVLYYGTAAQRRRARNRRAQAAAHVDLEEDDHKTAQLLVESPQLLMEMSFKQLLQAAQQNGWYRQGGAMRLRQGIWVIDPTVPGRVENSRFVITKPPSVTKAEDGSAVVYFSFKSRPDSSTTGQRARGYVRFLPDKRARYQFGNKCHVFCTCPDFKYHWAFVLARAGASHVPTGLGGEATNTAPNHTNPEGHLGICKHLAACSLYLTARSVDYNKLLTTMASEPRTPARPNPKPKPEPKPMVPKEEPKDEDGKDLEVAEIDPDVTPITSPENEP